MDKKKIEEGVRLILEGVGEDINREGIIGTPERVADMYEEIFSGIGKDPCQVLEPMFDENHDEIILVKDIPFYSTCEHHLVPFVGKAHIAYVPNQSGRIIGIQVVGIGYFPQGYKIRPPLTAVNFTVYPVKRTYPGTTIMRHRRHETFSLNLIFC